MKLKGEKEKAITIGSLKKEDEILVLVFVSSACPITSLYWDRMKGTWYNYRDKDVATVFVGGNSDDSYKKLREILDKHDLELPLVWDENHSIAKACQIEHTPLVVVIGKNGDVFYRGRIDDSWRDETQIKNRYLDTAMAAALGGKKTPDCVNDLFMGSRMR